MKKMKFETDNLSNKYIEAIGEIIPAVVTEIKGEDGKLKKVIDFDKFKTLLEAQGGGTAEQEDEKYEFTWVGKKEAMIEANKPIRKTLRPCKEESRDWDKTENLYIEGDNLEVLKLLQESYLNSVKMIYIDPPYNTGNDFIYNDDFKMSNDEYKNETGELDEEGNRLFKNTDSNGRFHSDWCSMIYSRIVLARNLLSYDGVICISINDKEQDTLKKICNEIFGEQNFVANLIWANKEGGGSSDSKLFRIKHEYILVYAKNINEFEVTGVKISNEDRYKSSDEYEKIRGKYYLQKLGMGSIQYSSSLDYPIEAPDGTFIMPKDNNKGKKACWRWSKDKYEWGKANGFIEIKKDTNNIWTVYTKQYLNCDNEGNLIERTNRPMGIIDEFSSTQGAKIIKQILGEAVFNYSKDVNLINWLIQRNYGKDITVLDFFSGSSTTAHAVMQLNAEDGGSRKFIMVQLPEECGEKSEAYKAGYKNICEIGKERIRRAGEQIKSENADKDGIENLDTGFRVLKLDDSNMKDVYYAPDDYEQASLFDLVSNIKEDRTSLDLLFGCLIDWGLPLNRPYESEEIDGSLVHIYNEGDLVACFDESISEETIKSIAKMEPLRAVFRDSSFTTSANKINVEEIFKLLSPDTSVRVI